MTSDQLVRIVAIMLLMLPNDYFFASGFNEANKILFYFFVIILMMAMLPVIITYYYDTYATHFAQRC